MEKSNILSILSHLAIMNEVRAKCEMIKLSAWILESPGYEFKKKDFSFYAYQWQKVSFDLLLFSLLYDLFLLIGEEKSRLSYRNSAN